VSRCYSRHHPLLRFGHLQSLTRAFLPRPSALRPFFSFLFHFRCGAGFVAALPWSFLPFDDIRCGKRPTPSVPAWLCYVLGFSQPLDVLIPPSSSQPYFMPVPPRFAPSECSLCASLAGLSTRSAPLGVSRSPLSRFSPHLQGFMHTLSPYSLGRCYPISSGRSSLGVRPSEVFLSQSRLPCGCLLSWASASRSHPAHAVFLRFACSAKFQRAEGSSPLSRLAPLPGVFSPISVPA